MLKRIGSAGGLLVAVLGALTLTGCSTYQRHMDPASVTWLRSRPVAVVYVDMPPIRAYNPGYVEAAGYAALGIPGMIVASGYDDTHSYWEPGELKPYNPILDALGPAVNQKIFQDVQAAVMRSPLLSNARFIHLTSADRVTPPSTLASRTGAPLALIVSPRVVIDRDGEYVDVILWARLWLKDSSTGTSDGQAEIDSLSTTDTTYLSIPGLIGGHSEWRSADAKLSVEQRLTQWFAVDSAEFKSAISTDWAAALGALDTYIQVSAEVPAGQILSASANSAEH